MGIVVSFRGYDLLPRFDGVPWSQLEIYEADNEDGPWTSLIDTQPIDPLAANPSDPLPISFSTNNGTVVNGWYMVRFLDDQNGFFDTTSIQNVPVNEILATLDDVNANLDGEVIEATPDNTDLVQISVARVVRAYLARIVDQPTMSSWITPEATPEIVREIAAKLIAAQVYFNEGARTALLVDQNSFAQRKYDEAMALLQGVIEGSISIIGPDGEPIGGVTPVEVMSINDFFPIDDTDRAFTLSMQL
jgi:hypothetical protein